MEKLNKIVIVLLLFLSVSAYADDRIVDIDFKGLIKVDEADLRHKISSMEGGAYSVALVNRDIKVLYETGLFADVSVEEQAIAGGVKLIFHVAEKGVVGAVSFKGNKKIKKKDLREAVSVHENGLLDESKLAESREAIRKLYEDKGYHLAEVTFEVVPLDTENNQVEVIFWIQENKGGKVRRISFIGNKFFSDRKLASQMKTKVKGFFGFISGSGKIKDEKLERDTQALTYFYLNHGFIKAKIGEPQISLTRSRQAINIAIPVYEGARYKVSEVDLAGDIITTREELLSKIKLKKGEYYNRQTQDEDTNNLAFLYGDQAYAFANIYPSIDTDDDQKTAKVTYVIEKGPKIYIERIDITGNTITRDKVIRRELQIKEQAPFSRSALDQSYRRLMQLGFFEEVNFSTPRGSADNKIVLVVKVKEKPTGTFSVGAGFSSLESFIFTATVQKENFFGLGLKGGVSANLSKLRQEFQFSMTDRYFLDTRWIFSTSLYRFSSALNRDFDQKSFGGSVSFGRELFPYFDFNLGYQVEDVSVTNFSSQVPAFFQANASGLTSDLFSTIDLDTRDNRIFTTKGLYNAVTTEYAGHGIGGDNNFWKISGDSRVFFPLPAKMVLKSRGMVSYVSSLDDNAVPLFSRFFLGGINTLRGFDLNSIGPQLRIPSTATGKDHLFTYGGNRMLLFNFEYEIPVYDPAGIRTVAFFDAGQAYGENETIDLTRLRSDYGFGLRWNSPFGPLRFEWGFPINRRSGESSTVFNFTIGQSF